MFSKIFFSFVLLLNLKTAAAEESHVGNGGHEVVCGEDRYLLDVYEGMQDPTFNIDMGLEQDIQKMFGSVLRKIQKLDEKLSHSISLYSVNFLMSTHYALDLIPTNDMGPIQLPSPCVLKQLAVQYFDHSREFELNVDAKLLSLENQVALYWHEILYAYALDQGHATSEKTREFVRFWISDRPNHITSADYIKLRDSLDFQPNHSMNGFASTQSDPSLTKACDKAQLQVINQSNRWCKEQLQTNLPLKLYSEEWDYLPSSGPSNWSSCTYKARYLCYLN